MDQDGIQRADKEFWLNLRVSNGLSSSKYRLRQVEFDMSLLDNRNLARHFEACRYFSHRNYIYTGIHHHKLTVCISGDRELKL
jgi:hypothetical protein